MTTYERIRRIRKEQKMSQLELAKRAGYSDRSSIAWIENGRIDLPQSKLKKIADALNVPVAYLFDGEAPDPDSEELIRKFEKLDDIDRARISERIDMMLEADKYHEDH